MLQWHQRIYRLGNNFFATLSLKRNGEDKYPALLRVVIKYILTKKILKCMKEYFMCVTLITITNRENYWHFFVFVFTSYHNLLFESNKVNHCWYCSWQSFAQIHSITDMEILNAKLYYKYVHFVIILKVDCGKFLWETGISFRSNKEMGNFQNSVIPHIFFHLT